MYSFVNIAVVARDLARHDRGAALAADLLAALALDPVALSALDAKPVAVDVARRRRGLTDRLAHEPRAAQALTAVSAAAEVAGRTSVDASLAVLEAAPIGGWAELARWLRGEILEAAWRRSGDVAVLQWPGAVDIVTDGLLATYVGADALAGPLAGPWRSWVGTAATAVVTQPVVAQVVDMVAAADHASLAAAGAALRQAREDGWSWPLAMHDACWAIELTGRSRSTAVAQLTAVRGVLAVTGARPHPDVVAAVAAAVHGTAAADVLASEAVAALCRPLLTHLR